MIAQLPLQIAHLPLELVCSSLCIPSLPFNLWFNLLKLAINSLFHFRFEMSHFAVELTQFLATFGIDCGNLYVETFAASSDCLCSGKVIVTVCSFLSRMKLMLAVLSLRDRKA